MTDKEQARNEPNVRTFTEDRKDMPGKQPYEENIEHGIPSAGGRATTDVNDDTENLDIQDGQGNQVRRDLPSSSGVKAGTARPGKQGE